MESGICRVDGCTAIASAERIFCGFQCMVPTNIKLSGCSQTPLSDSFNDEHATMNRRTVPCVVHARIQKNKKNSALNFPRSPNIQNRRSQNASQSQGR